MAGGMGTGAANSLLLLVLNTTTWANVAINATASPITNIELSGHTASPSGSAQTTNECAYGSYARVAVSRASGAGGFTVTTVSAALSTLTSFPAATSGTETMTHFGLGTAHTSTGSLIFWGTVTPNIAIATGVTPQITTATCLTVTT
jgi:hypothetical protein